MLDPISLASAGIGVAGGIYGAIKAGEERKKMDRYLSGREAENEAMFNKDYYGDYTNRADVQALQKKLRENLRRENQITNQTAAITGATPEASLVQKDQNNKVMTDTTSNIAAQGQQFKDRVQDRYLNMKNQYANMRYGEMEKSAASYENLMGNGIKQIGGALQGAANTAMLPNSNRADMEIVKSNDALANGINMGALKTPQTGVAVTGGIDPDTIKFNAK